MEPREGRQTEGSSLSLRVSSVRSLLLGGFLKWLTVGFILSKSDFGHNNIKEKEKDQEKTLPSAKVRGNILL